MERRIFYAARPHEVVTGLLAFLLSGGLLALIVYGMASGRAHGAAWGLIKLVPFVFAAAATMLYRERVIADAGAQRVEVRRSLFVIPLSRKTYRFSSVRSVRWKPRPHGRQAQLVLETLDGSECVLRREARPDQAVSREVRAYFGLSPNPEHDVLPPVPAASSKSYDLGRAGVVILVILLVILAVLLVRTYG